MFENIVAGIIATLICSIIAKLLESLKNNKVKTSTFESGNEQTTLKDITMARKQFFICLIYLFIIVIGLIFNLFGSGVLLTFIFVTAIFTFILCWGAFDAIFHPFNRKLKKVDNQLANEDSRNN
ncbi:hypothetical protein [Priestia flexa]|uniref:hypothetical protein n=1 Tax=Priestia flexa TaxID=86664 RepID=UPI001F4CF18D|nr:hypothetical protein [Priestia flexa]